MGSVSGGIGSADALVLDERARGQFVNRQASLTKAEQRKFLIQNPKNQMFTKTDLAKYVRTFEELPHEVSKGAQKNFSGFASELGSGWERCDGTDFNELWFKRLIGKAILFRQLDARVLRANWYVGYKANIVTYALAKFSQLVRERRVYIDFLKIWNLQLLPEELASQLLEIANSVHTILLSRPGGITSNVSEWAKSEECWTAIRSEKMQLGAAVEEYFLDSEENKDLEKDEDVPTSSKAEFKTRPTFWRKAPSIGNSCATGILSIANLPPRRSTSSILLVLCREKSPLKNRHLF